MPTRRKPPNAGKGRPKGALNKKTIKRQLIEQELQQKLREELTPIVEAQIANAKGIKYIVVREKKGGKFVRVTQAMAEARKGLGSDEEIIEVWEKDPSVHAFQLILDRAYGKAKEPERKIEGRLEISWKD